jgi:hypothetical protein
MMINPRGYRSKYELAKEVISSGYIQQQQP